MKSELSTTLIIVGITGDLSQRMLLPAIEKISAAGALPDEFKIIGISRRDVKVDEVVDTSLTYVREHTHMIKMDLDNKDDYQMLGSTLEDMEQHHTGISQRLYYLSVPPEMSLPIVTHLGESGLSNVPNTKLLLEKPFGVDLQSAKDMVSHLDQYFSEDSIYRIDHFVAKEMAQNIVFFRTGNSLFKRTWNNSFISSIHIIASENIDIEGRKMMYEQTGALRDLIQSHLMQLAALTLMELPPIGPASLIPAKRLEALQKLKPASPADAVRKQYNGYKDEVELIDTTTETFASVTLYSEDPTWQNVPITLTTGKALSEKYTEIQIEYTKDDEREANQLILKLSPRQEISISIWTKKPGYDRVPVLSPMDYLYSDHYASSPEAYEKVFIDAMNSDHSLFTTSEEVLESWRILQPVIDSWSNPTIKQYEKGQDLASILQK